uniref:Uncharacterized protein n=1 Tax=Arundo donax TaxID=35708 RepID=A0A0A9DSH5_ARUDO
MVKIWMANILNVKHIITHSTVKDVTRCQHRHESLLMKK